MVVFYSTCVTRHDSAEELANSLRFRLPIDEDFVHLRIVQISYGTDDEVALPIESGGCVLRFHRGDQVLPNPCQIPEITFQDLLRLVRPSSPNDQPHLGGTAERGGDLPETITLFWVLDLARDSRPRHPEHQDQKSSLQGDKGGRGGALTADRLLRDLNQQRLAFTQNVLYQAL